MASPVGKDDISITPNFSLPNTFNPILKKDHNGCCAALLCAALGKKVKYEIT